MEFNHRHPGLRETERMGDNTNRSVDVTGGTLIKVTMQVEALLQLNYGDTRINLWIQSQVPAWYRWEERGGGVEGELQLRWRR